MPTTLDALVVELKAKVDGLEAGLRSGAQSVDRFSKGAEQDISRIPNALNVARNAVLAFGGAWAAWSVGREVVEAGMEMQALENRMKAATGSSEVAANAMAYVREESERLGLSFVTAADGFAGFSASALRAGLTLQQTKDIFTGVSEVATSLHLSGERVGLVFKALEQIAAKGTVQMEELKGQLGESLPGAFELAAKAMGVTTAQLGKMMEQGQVMAADFLPKFAAAIKRDMTGSLEEASQSAQAAMNRLGNALFDLKTRFANAGILDAVTKGVEDLTAALNDPQVQNGLIQLASLLGRVANAAVQAAAAIGSIPSYVEKGGDKVFGAAFGQQGIDAVQRQRSRKAGEATFEQRMVQQYISDFNTKHAPATPEVSGDYTLGKVSPPDTSKADKAAARAATKAENARKAAAAKAQREAEAAQRERESLGGRVRDMGVSMGSDPDKYRAELEDQQKILEEALAKKAITQQKFDDMMAEAKNSHREKEKEYILEEFGTKTEQEDKRYQDQQKKLEDALELKLVTEEDHRRITEELEQEHQDKLTQIKEDAAKDAAEKQLAIAEFRHNAEEQLMSSGFALANVFAGKNKALAIAMLAFEKSKAIAESIIYTNVAAAKALIQDPSGATSAYVTALGYANVAIIAATGIAQAAMLASGDSSSGSPGKAGTTFNASTGQYEQATSSAAAPSAGNIFINLQGSDTANFTKTQVRELIGAINDAQKDGTRLNVVTVT